MTGPCAKLYFKHKQKFQTDREWPLSVFEGRKEKNTDT